MGEKIEVQMREQATLLAISHTLASTLEFQPGLILDQLREIIEYTHCRLFALEDSTLVTLATRGTPQLEQSSPFRIHLQGPETLVALFNGHQPIRIADIWSDNPQAQFLRALLNDGASALIEGMESWMWVPLAVKGSIIGGIGVAHEKRDYFAPHHADLAHNLHDAINQSLFSAGLIAEVLPRLWDRDQEEARRSLEDLRKLWWRQPINRRPPGST